MFSDIRKKELTKLQFITISLLFLPVENTFAETFGDVSIITVSTKDDFEEWWSGGPDFSNADTEPLPPALSLLPNTATIWFLQSNSETDPIPFSYTFRISERISQYSNVKIEIKYFSASTNANLKPMQGAPDNIYEITESTDPANWSRIPSTEVDISEPCDKVQFIRI